MHLLPQLLKQIRILHYFYVDKGLNYIIQKSNLFILIPRKNTRVEIAGGHAVQFIIIIILPFFAYTHVSPKGYGHNIVAF